MNLPLITKIIIALIVCVGLGFLSGYFTASSINTWYSELNKPFFNPPNWIFGPAWTLLYTLMAVAFALVWDSRTKIHLKSKAMKLFVAQFALNLVWTPVFFGLHQIAIALLIIVFLWILIFKTMQAFKRVNMTSYYLMIPYLLWVSFATALNASILYLNS